MLTKVHHSPTTEHVFMSPVSQHVVLPVHSHRLYSGTNAARTQFPPIINTPPQAGYSFFSIVAHVVSAPKMKKIAPCCPPVMPVAWYRIPTYLVDL